MDFCSSPSSWEEVADHDGLGTTGCHSPASSDTEDELYFTPEEGVDPSTRDGVRDASVASSSGSSTLRAVPEDLFSALRERAQGPCFSFDLEQGDVEVATGTSAAPSTVACCFRFVDSTARRHFWARLEPRLGETCAVWFSPSGKVSTPPGGSVTETGTDAAPSSAVTLVLLLRPIYLFLFSISGVMRLAEVRHVVEKAYLGCPRSRGNRLAPLLRRPDDAFFEVISDGYAENGWLRSRRALLQPCVLAFVHGGDWEAREADATDPLPSGIICPSGT